MSAAGVEGSRTSTPEPMEWKDFLPGGRCSTLSPAVIAQLFADKSIDDLEEEDVGAETVKKILTFLKKHCDGDVVVPRDASLAQARLIEWHVSGLQPGRGLTRPPSGPSSGEPGSSGAGSGGPNSDWPGRRDASAERGVFGDSLVGRGDERPDPYAGLPPGVTRPAVSLGPDLAPPAQSLLGSVLGPDGRVAPNALDQVSAFHGGQWQRFASGVNIKNPRNIKEVTILCFALDLLHLDLQRAGVQPARFMRESDGVEVLVRRALAIQEADRLNNWDVAAEIEIAPEGRLMLPRSLREGIRKGVANEQRLRGKERKGSGADA